jgi:hypothetical protein
MTIRRTVFGVALATASLLAISSCGGEDKPPQTVGTPSATSSTPTPTPTPVDPTVVAKAKVLADYKNFIAVRSKGITSNDPTFAYDQVMTGVALAATKSVASGSQMIGTKYSGSVRFIKGQVVSLNLKAKPATATVHACVFDSLSSRTKSGKVNTASTEVSRQDQMVLIGNRWKASFTKSLSKDAPGCQ